MEVKELIGLDIGIKFTGIARASTAAKIAQPLGTVPTDDLLQKLSELSKVQQIEAIVVGLPRNLSGDDTKQTKWVRNWVAENKPKISLPMFWSDEALTSTGGGKTGKDDHTQAAATILQDFINTPKTGRVLC